MKAIILARVSTDAQDYTEQVNDLVNTAIDDGYKGSELIIIENKESALKNDEENRLGLVEMKEAIANDPTINRVYCREVTRIGRTYPVLSSIKTFLVTNKIQLIVNGDTRIEVLDKNGEITLQGNLLFEIACQVATQEMADKKIRFAQGRARAVKEGKAGQGNVKYGYQLDKNNYIIINEDEASVVRRLFNQYANTKISTIALYHELIADGTWSPLSSDITGGNKVRVMLSNYCYSGRNHLNKAHNELKYQAIVSEDLQDRAIAKLHAMKAQRKFITKYTYYAKSLVKCPVCGHTMAADIATITYLCPFCGKRHSINQLEWLAWNSAVQLKLMFDITKQRETIKQYTRDIAENESKIKVQQNRLHELDELEESIVESSLRITDVDRRKRFQDRKLGQVTEERKKANRTILRLRQVNDQMHQCLLSLTSPVATDGTGIVPILEITDDTKRKEIIDSVLDSIVLKEIDSKHIHITINPKKVIANDYCYDYIYDKSTMPYPKTIEHHKVYDTYTEVTSEVAANRRFTKAMGRQRRYECKINARAKVKAQKQL